MRREGASKKAPLILVGDELILKRIEIDGAAIDASAYQATPDQLIIPAPPAAQNFRLTLETEVSPSANSSADGPLPLQRRLLYPVRGRRLPPHHLFPRQARPSFRLYGAHRGRAAKRRCFCRMATQRKRASFPTAGTLPSGTIRIPKPAYLFALVAGDLGMMTRFHHRFRPPCRSRHLCRAWQGTPRALCHGCAEAVDEMGRGGLRPRI